MQLQALSIQNRTSRLVGGVEKLIPFVDTGPRGRAISTSALTACKAMDDGYRHACSSASPTEFISRISTVARQAKKTKAALMLLAQLGYAPIASIRELIIEARRLENIFVSSRNTAKRRQPGRLVSVRDSFKPL